MTREDEIAPGEAQFELSAGEATPGQFFLLSQEHMEMFLASRCLHRNEDNSE